MALPTMTGTGNLTRAVGLRFTPAGKAVANLGLAFNSRKYDRDTGQWEDGDTLFIDATAWDAFAENIAEQDFTTRDKLVISGKLKTQQWKDKQTGDNRSKVVMDLDSIGRAVSRFAVEGQQTQGGYAQTQPDPWAGSQPQGQQQPITDEPPF